MRAAARLVAGLLWLMLAGAAVCVSFFAARAQEVTLPDVPADVFSSDTTGRAVAEEKLRATEEELARIRKDLDEKRSTAADIAGQEQDAVLEIERLNEEMRVNQELLHKLGQRKAVLLDDLNSAQRDLTRAQASLAAAGDLLGERLRGIYKFGRGQVMEVLLTSKTFPDLAKRIYYLSIVADQDRQLILEFESSVETKRVLVEHIDGRRARLEQNEAEVAEQTRNLASMKEERDALLTRLKSKRSYYESMARDLQETSRNLEELLGGFEAGRGEASHAGGTFRGKMGGLIWPCDGEVISDFGVEQHPKFGTIIKNNGIDIRTDSGTRVRAVAAGSVSFAGPLSGFGNCVIVDHGSGYYTLYGRLESVMVTTGLGVDEGDALGSVSETSAPEGAVLHFEIRQGKKALDPRLWLVK
jgi:septal ring factor EnvC (AmiA/AmiB activator)